jgi:hypothetical protein
MNRLLPSPIAAVIAAACLLSLASCSTGQPGSEGSSPAARPSPSRPATSAVAGHCDGQLGPGSVDGDVTVPDGATCELRGIRVGGNISIGHRAHLVAEGVDVDGDLEGEGTATVEVTSGSRVGGNLQLESGGSVLVSNSHVGGDLSWEEQHGTLRADGNTVSGNLELDGNTGATRVSDNEIHGDLSCDENAPTPVGGHNSVSGDQEGQCRGL